MTTNEDLLFEKDGPVGLITFNRPEARNALTFAMYQHLVDICREPEDLGVKVLVLTGAYGVYYVLAEAVVPWSIPVTWWSLVLAVLIADLT